MTSPSHAYDSSVISHLLSVASLEEAKLKHVRKHALTTRIHDDLELREYAFCSGTRRLYEDNQADSVLPSWEEPRTIHQRTPKLPDAPRSFPWVTFPRFTHTLALP